MATRPTGGVSGRGGKQKPPASGRKSASGSKPRPSGQASGTGKKTAPPRTPKPKKTPSGGRKKGRRSPGGSRLLWGLMFGLLVAAVSLAVVRLHPETGRNLQRLMPHLPKVTVSLPWQGEKKLSGPGRSRPAEPAKPGKKAVAVVYEEQQGMDRLVKKLDQGIYSALKDIGVPDRDVNFLDVEHRRAGNFAWDQAVIEVSMTRDADPEAVVSRIKSAFAKIRLDSSPSIKLTGTRDDTPEALVYYEGLMTHTIRFRLTDSPGARSAHRSETARPSASPGADSPGKAEKAPEEAKPVVAIVIDDFGQSSDQADCFLSLPFPVAFSILPFLPGSKAVALRVHKQGLPVMLHMPMQPGQWPEVDPGPGAILVNMTRDEVQRRVQSAMDAVPFAAGINNHMGSRFTEDRTRMEWTLEMLKQKGMFYLDSRTSTRSLGYVTARRLGLQARSRSIFIDNVQDADAIRIQLKKLVAAARKYGSAIGIGHVYPVTCQVLNSEYGYLSSKVTLVPITSLFNKE